MALYELYRYINHVLLTSLGNFGTPSTYLHVIVTIMCHNDELSWLFTSELFILFADHSQILLKISVIPILLTFMYILMYLVALNLLVHNQLIVELNSSLWHIIVTKVSSYSFSCILLLRWIIKYLQVINFYSLSNTKLLLHFPHT